jgi:hypothetical protein
MTEAERHAVERACEALSIAYARAIDFRDYDAFILLFTDDAVLCSGGVELNGRGEIRESLRNRSDEIRSRHVITNVFIDPLTPDSARGISYVTVYRHSGPESLERHPVPMRGPAAVGHYEDRFVRTADGWQFASRRLHLAFRDTLQF